MKYRNILSFTFSIVLAAAFSVSAAAQSVTGSLADSTVSRGTSVKGTITLTIPDGLHVNSNKPESEYAIPTTVRISGIGLKPGTIEYPEGSDRKFEFSETELNVYEGEIKIPFTVEVLKSYRGDTISVKALVRFQACTDEVCYPPKNQEVVMTAAVR